MIKLTLGFSPCPNDTFIFDALVNNKINAEDFVFDVVLEDVETLNKWALQKKLDITKLSYAVLPMVLEDYIVMNSGSALGRSVGPLLITSTEQGSANVEDRQIAIPGEHTTAHLLFSLAFPKAKNKIFLRYNEIEDFVLNGNGLGVIIHENRFTYEGKGLIKIIDLGDYWEKETGNPIPLGGIVIKRSVDNEVALKVDRLIRKSIEYAYQHHYRELAAYVKRNAQEMSEAIMRKHIDLYVNDYSVSLNNEGKTAIKKLLNIHQFINKSSTQVGKGIFLNTNQP